MKIKFIFFCFILSVILFNSNCSNDRTQARITENFNKGWKFRLGDTTNVISPSFDDSGWRSLNLPHDWSIEGEFNKDNPATPVGGALPGGIGWYRKTFRIKNDLTDKQVFIDFDGIYRNSEVWINGQYLGKRPYGYISFEYELTPYIKTADQDNVIAIKVDNSVQPNSRWYSGSGIYRNVRLITTHRIHIDHWGSYITTPEITEQSARVKLSVRVVNSSQTARDITLVTTIFDPAEIKTAESEPIQLLIAPGTSVDETFNISIKSPSLWSTENPSLYKAITSVETEGKTVDQYETPFGIRYFEFDKDKGFILNGKHLKILGVCDHHDLGCLGAAIHMRALERQLEILKNMGCNAIRTSHNPPAPELLELCDKMGFLVMDEAFDMWKVEKREFDYHLDWDAWHKKDLGDMVLRDRNHPSIIIWSIGNEIREQLDTTGMRIARELAGIVKSFDSTRPVTSALDYNQPDNYIYKSGALDLVGFNYRHELFGDFPKNFPGQKFIASETTSAIATRGHYDMPSDSIRRWPIRWDIEFTQGNPDYTCSAYDNCSVYWGSTHEETWKVVKNYDFISGMFIWTGFDYLGEPTPYPWPARSSYFGIIDLAGFPKDCYYMYQSEWTQKPVLHIFPHWNWKQGEIVDIWAYTNVEKVELFLNDQSLGTRQKQGDQIHLMWRVPFTPGKLLAVGYTKGKEILRSEVHTAGKPAKIILEADRKSLKADGTDLSFVTIRIVDQDGNLVPDASNLVHFNIQGNGFIAGVDNGNPISHESFKANYRQAFNGLCLAVIQSDGTPGKIQFKAESENLEPASLEIGSQ
jgi:beta-galactosidase